MYVINWVDKKGACWSKQTADKKDALATIKSLYKRKICAACIKRGVAATHGAVWQMGDGTWSWFFDMEKG